MDRDADSLAHQTQLLLQEYTSLERRGSIRVQGSEALSPRRVLRYVCNAGKLTRSGSNGSTHTESIQSPAGAMNMSDVPNGEAAVSKANTTNAAQKDHIDHVVLLLMENH